MGEELKPCPFCGGKPKEYDQIGYSSVKCKPCNFSIKVKSMDGPPYAPELWNTRAQLPSRQGAGEAAGYFNAGETGELYELFTVSKLKTWYYTEPLYTHPANPDSVPVRRELLCRVLDGRPADVWSQACKELRQLLAKSEGVKS